MITNIQQTENPELEARAVKSIVKAWQSCHAGNTDWGWFTNVLFGTKLMMHEFGVYYYPDLDLLEQIAIKHMVSEFQPHGTH